MNALAAHARRVPWLTLALCATALALHATLDVRALAFDPGRPSLLRVLGCHFVHFSRLHLVWDTLTFGIVGAVTERVERARHATFLLAAALLVPVLACTLSPWVKHYAGLSGLVLGQVALLLASALRRAARTRDARGAAGPALLLLMLFAKQLYELHSGNTSLVTMDYHGFTTVPAAHLVSVVIGTLAGCAGRRARRCTHTLRPSAHARISLANRLAIRSHGGMQPRGSHARAAESWSDARRA